MTRTRLLHLTAISVLLLVLAGALTSPSALQAATRQDTVTVQITADDLSRLPLITPVSRIDYAAFSILELTRQDLRALRSARIRITEEKSSDTVRLQGREIALGTAIQNTSVLTSTPGLYIVHLPGPAKRDWMTRIESSGAIIVSYIPDNSYLVWADPSAMTGLRKLAFLKWSDSYSASRKVATSLKNASGTVTISVTIYEDPDGKTIKNMRDLGASLILSDNSRSSSGALLTTAVFSADASLISKIADLARTVYIDRAHTTVKLDDEIACQIAAHNLSGLNIPLSTPTYQSWLSGLGYNGAGVKIAVVDTGFDTNNNSSCHLDMRGRLSNVFIYQGTDSPDPSGHGTHVTTIAAGNAALGTTDSSGFLYGQGIAPGASVVVQNAAANISVFPPVPWETLTHDATRSGALVSNNSWSFSTSVNIGYTSNCAAFDRLVRDADDSTGGLQPLGIVFSLGNAGPNASTVGDPKEGKNIITVGASENYRPNNPLGTGCGASSNVQGVADLSSRGPCADGRMAPTLVAPGTAMSSAASYWGDYNGGGCKAIINPLSPDYSWMSGTSMSAPVVTGAAALIGQWWRATHFGQNPGPAMLKAILVNGADDLYGGPDGRGGTLTHIPNNDQGWGRVDIANSVNPPDTFYEDQAHVFTEGGQIHRYRVETKDPGKPLKITLAWTDAPGLAGASAWVNDLDLSAASASDTYLGNVFSNGWSATGGSRDYKNNVECIYIQNPSGIYTISVIAANIAGDAIPGNGYPTDQDYALVVRNGTVGGPVLQPYVPVDSSTPAQPDHYSAVQQPGGWSAVALRPVPTGENDVTLYTDAGYAAAAATANSPGSNPKFIAIDGNRPTPVQLYPLVSTNSGNVGYTVEWATRTADLVPGVVDARTFGASDLIRTWDLAVSGATTCGLQVLPTSGDLDLGVCIFNSTSGQSATYYRTKSQALFHDDPSGAGNAHTMLFQLPAAGRYGLVVWKNGGTGSFSVKSDLSAPTAVLVTSGSAYTADLTTLSASWTSSDLESGIAKYEYAIGTTPGGIDIVGWTDVGTSTSIQRTDLTLTADSSYYFSVRATNGFGMTTTGTSGPIIAVMAVPSIAAAKALGDQHYIQLTARNVSAAYSGRFYIQDPNRASGIGVDWNGAVQEGSTVTVIGKTTTGDYLERLIQGLQVTSN